MNELLTENHEVDLALKIIPAQVIEKKEEREKTFDLVAEEIAKKADQQILDCFIVEKIDEFGYIFSQLHQVSAIEPSTYIPTTYMESKTQP